MARTTVEILGGQLDGTILQNAASEETLRSISAALKDLNTAAGSLGGNGSTGTNSSQVARQTAQTFKKSGLLGAAMEGLGKQIGNVIGAAGSFAGMLVQGETKLSKYTTAINDQIVKQLPLFGKTLGLFGDGVNYAIGAFEEWNDFLTQSSKVGASFNNSVIEMRLAAFATYNDLDEFVSILRKNSKDLPAFGGTVSKGAKALTEYNRYMMRSGGLAREELFNMGITTADITESLANYMNLTMRSGVQQRRTIQDTEQSFVSYRKHIDRLSKITGQSADKIEEELRSAAEDAAFQLKLNQLDDKSRSRMVEMMAVATTMLGPNGASMMRAAFLQLAPQTEGAQDLNFLFPQLYRQLQGLIGVATSGIKDEDLYNNQVTTSMASMLSANSRQILENQKMFEVLSLLPEGASMYEAASTVLNYISRQGDITKLDQATFENIIGEAFKEQKKREEITEMLRRFDLAIRDLRKSFFEAITPGLERLSEYFKTNDVAGMFQTFGTKLGNFVTVAMPKFIKTIEFMTSEDGRTFLLNEVTHFFSKVGLYLKSAITRTLTPSFFKSNDAFEVDLQGKLDKLTQDHERTQKALEGKMESSRQQSSASQSSGPRRPAPINTGMLDPVSTLYASRYGLDNLSPIVPAGSRTTSPYGAQRGNKTHQGVDLAPPKPGETGLPLYSAADGIFSTGYESGGYGRWVKIADPSTGFSFMYGHLDEHSSRSLFQRYGLTDGSEVNRGSQIGIMGSSGRSTGIHLHFEVRDPRGVKQDPNKFFESFTPKESFRKGTLGETGQLFKNFGGGTQAMLHNQEAVLTPSQMSSILEGSTSTEMSNLMETLNGNLTMLVSLTKQRITINREQLAETQRMSGDMFT